MPNVYIDHEDPMYYGDLASMSGYGGGGGGHRGDGPLPEPVNVICKQCGHGRKDHSNKPNQIQQNADNKWRCCGRMRKVTKQDNGIKRITWSVCLCDLNHEEIEYNAADTTVTSVYEPSDEMPMERLK